MNALPGDSRLRGNDVVGVGMTWWVCGSGDSRLRGNDVMVMGMTWVEAFA